MGMEVRQGDEDGKRRWGRLTLEEVRLEVDLEEVSSQSLDRVIEGKNVDALSVLDVVAGVYASDVTKLDTKVVAGDLVELDLALVNVLG